MSCSTPCAGQPEPPTHLGRPARMEPSPEPSAPGEWAAALDASCAADTAPDREAEDLTREALRGLAAWAPRPRPEARLLIAPQDATRAAPDPRRGSPARAVLALALSGPLAWSAPAGAQPGSAHAATASPTAFPTVSLAAPAAAAVPASTSSRSTRPAQPKPPAEVVAALPQARLVGQGALRFFGLSVYEARLWAAPGFDAARYDGQAFALELQYARKLAGPAIAERSIVEMKRVGPFADAQATEWQALMTRAFPDVVAGDRLSGVHLGSGQVRFFHNGRLTAQLDDAPFARLFFGIWLAPQTSAPALRQSLIGGDAPARPGS